MASNKLMCGCSGTCPGLWKPRHVRKFVLIEKLLEKSDLKPARSGTGKPQPLELFYFKLKEKSLPEFSYKFFYLRKKQFKFFVGKVFWRPCLLAK